MKSRFNIAICFSGESRSFNTAAPFIKAFLGNTDHNIKFFCHTWAKNTWKCTESIRHDLLDAENLKRELQETYPFEKIQVDAPIDDMWIKLKNNTLVHAHSVSPFKSAALVNQQKRQYEMVNEMVFDIVFKLRLDTIFHRHINLEFILSSITKPLTDEVIMDAQDSSVREFRHPWCYDMCYYGSSLGMDIISDLYFYYINGKFFEMANCSIFNPSVSRYGPNAQLHKWASMKNLKIGRYDCKPLIVYPVRYEVQHATYPEGYDLIEQRFLNG